jgi:hypothetical protein
MPDPDKEGLMNRCPILSLKEEEGRTRVEKGRANSRVFLTKGFAGLGVEGNHGDVLFPYLYIVVIGISLGALALSR